MAYNYHQIALKNQECIVQKNWVLIKNMVLEDAHAAIQRGETSFPLNFSVFKKYITCLPENIAPIVQERLYDMMMNEENYIEDGLYIWDETVYFKSKASEKLLRKIITPYLFFSILVMFINGLIAIELDGVTALIAILLIFVQGAIVAAYMYEHSD